MAEETKNTSNPFLDLFGQQQQSSSSSSTSKSTLPSETMDKKEIFNSSNLNTKENDLIEKIFLFTVNKDVKSKTQLVFMEEVSALCENGQLTLDVLEQALFERLLLVSPQDYLIPNDHISDTYVAETKVFIYLYKTFACCKEFENNGDPKINKLCLEIRSLIMRNICTAIKQPELYAGQSLSLQWLDILKDNAFDSNTKKDFLLSTTKELLDQDEEIVAMGHLKGIFYPMFNEMQKLVREANMINLDKWIIDVIMLFLSDKTTSQLGVVFIDFTTPNPDTEGRAFSETLLGQLLSLSILPKYQNGTYEFFSNPTDSLSDSISSSLWSALTKHLDDMHVIFKSLLTLGDDCKRKTLTWIGNCLHANIPRGQTWNTHNLASLGTLTSASDAFMIGLCGVLLRLCQPLFKPNLKVLLVDPTYCAVPEDQRTSKNVHLKNVCKDTCLLPAEDNETRLISNSYNFITECFFMTHKAIDLSYRVCIELFMRMARELNKLQSAYGDAAAQGRSDVAQSMMEMLNKLMQQFFCLKHTLIEPNNDQLLLQMCEATAIWLVEIAAKPEDEIVEMSPEKGFAPKVKKDPQLPLSNYVPPYLKCVPEYLIQNVLSYLTFMRHFENQAIRFDLNAQISIVRMILTFIGSIERCRNPHLRAALAEGLASFIPKENSSIFTGTGKLFNVHPDRLQIVPNLLNVFVSIEMTGQSVQFEQKFQYRRPMYAIMEFLWEIDEQKECFKQLAAEAEKKMEEINPPIFLRFINLLINDAIHLLDDSLTNLQQIRTLQATQDSGEWNSLPDSERQRNIADLQQLGHITRFDNILGKDTINILKLLTSEIKGIFCHETMVDRIASMLNYFLLNLVGPKKKEFKVKDKKEFDFDPAHTVKEICQIYVNLKENDAFCLAVSQDGRSYSSELFEYADQILRRIGGGQLIGDMNEFSNKVRQIEKQHKEDQEALTDIPDEYLDPIMSTLMMDPVILPSSRVTVDRATIARHLLSDQSDPFNRSPLTMDQIQPNVQLKEEIRQWIEQKRKEYSEKQQQQNEEKEKEKVESIEEKQQNDEKKDSEE